MSIRSEVVRYWVLYLGVLVFGVIWIILGLALQQPVPWFVRVLFVLFGGLLIGVGALSLMFGDRKQIIPSFESSDRRRAARLGLLITLGAAAGAAYIAISYPFECPEWQDQMGWIGWIFFAALLWFIAAGILMVIHART